jgi:3-oxoacyl-[acyl-carrier-protein] synthase-1
MNFGLSPDFGRETVDGLPLITGHVANISPGFTGKARLALLGSAGLADLVRRSAITATELTDCAFCLNLSDRFIEETYAVSLKDGCVPEEITPPPDSWKGEAASMVDLLLKRCQIDIHPSNRTLFFGGHAGFAAALEQATAYIDSGRYFRVIVGAVDCCVEPRFLEASASLRMLKTGDNPTGFSPGECAAFVLCERVVASGAKRRIAARVSSIAVTEDKAHQFSETPPVGGGLEQAIQGSMASRPDFSPSFVVSDLNGTERRALDWGHATVRVRQNFDVGSLPVWLPAVNFGETGAAAGAVAVCVATRAFERHYEPGPQALVCMASDTRSRASLIVERGAV